MGTTEITVPEGTPFIEITREVAAPRALVYRAYTDPELLKQWLGPRKYEMVVDRWDVRDGGAWRYVHRDDAGNAYGFHGVFHSIAPDNMVQTFEFDGAPGHVSLEKVVFEDLGNGRTRIRNHSVYQSVEARDAMVQAGMAEGVNEGYERLDELLAQLAVPVGR
ncbi:MAG TPA: SRPBCC family protein [Candidatus Polarisedimenticolia bacterium]|nr:SRPBCC family protein [Candidatus Polarisedimenticolia bacterium]